MKRKVFSSLIGAVLCITLLIAAVPLIQTQAASEIEVLNPLGKIEAQQNLPLAERLSTLNGKTVGFIYWDRPGCEETATAIQELLAANYSNTNFYSEVIDEHFEQTQAWYKSFADKADAFVIATADDSACTWWSTYHARELERRGIPGFVTVPSTYAPTLASAAEDNGLTELRSLVLPQNDYTYAFTKQVSGKMNVSYLKDNVISPLYQTIIDNLTAPLTDSEKAPGVITPRAIPDTFTVSGDTYDEALEAFTAMSLEMDFGDGLPLVLPTREAVNAMLRGTTRSPDDVLGKIRMKNGICTIEKLAINAVMAGAQPEYFPVIVAAMEVIAESIEDQSFYYDAMTRGEDYTLMLILNGPLADELGVSGLKGYMGALGDAKMTIGRAVRLAIRNIGHNIQPYVDTARMGRHWDHSLVVFAENDELSAYEPLSVTMGYTEDQSTVTVVAVGPWYTHAQNANSEPNGWDILGTINQVGHYMLRTAYGTNSSPTGSANYNANLLPAVPVPTEDVTLFFLSPAQSYSAREDLGLSKTELKEWFTKNGQSSSAGNFANYAANANVVMPVVVGEDPSYCRVFESTGYGVNAFRTQLITGATLTQAGRDDTAPCAPRNVTAVVGANSVTLNWKAPMRACCGNIIRYEVTCNDIRTGAWIDVGMNTSYTFEGLEGGRQYTFEVRAVNDAGNSSVFVNNALSDRGSGRGARASAAAFLPTSLKIDNAALVTLRKNATLQLSPIFAPAGASATVVWSSTNSAFATVDANGLVTAKATGTAVITAKTADGVLLSTVTIRITA